MNATRHRFQRISRRRRTLPAAITAAALVGGGVAACSPGSSGAAATPASSASRPGTASGPAATRGSTPVRVVIGHTVLHGVLWDNAAARSLIGRLPLTLAFSDLNGQEKIGHLARPLSMQGMPAGADPQPADIGWYAPWGNVVFYYGDVGYWDGIARIGQFTSSMAPIRNQAGDFRATIELGN